MRPHSANSTPIGSCVYVYLLVAMYGLRRQTGVVDSLQLTERGRLYLG